MFIYIKMAVKKVVQAVKKVVNKVVKKPTKVVEKVEEEFVVELPTPTELFEYQLAKTISNNILKIEVPAIISEVGEYDKELLWYHLDRIDGVQVSKQELRAIFASLFR
jgi:hypothetical protein